MPPCHPIPKKIEVLKFRNCEIFHLVPYDREPGEPLEKIFALRPLPCISKCKDKVSYILVRHTRDELHCAAPLTSLLRHRFYHLLASHTMLPPCHPPAQCTRDRTACASRKLVCLTVLGSSSRCHQPLLPSLHGRENKAVMKNA